MKYIIPILLIASLLSGCATKSKLMTRTYTPAHYSEEVVSFPALNTDAKVEIGQSIIFTASRTVVPAIKLTHDLRHDWENLGKQYAVTIHAGMLSAKGKDKEGVYFQAKKKVIGQEVESGRVDELTGGIYLPHNKSQPSEIFLLRSDRIPLNDPHPEIDYSVTSDEEWGENSFKRELIYSGVSQSTVSILYREFKNDMARPAFSQELKYDLSQSKIIGFRGARFQVIKATNIELQFKVLKNID